MNDKLTEPMGVSQWKEYGKKYGYWDYFVKDATETERKRCVGIIKSHQTRWEKELDKDGEQFSQCVQEARKEECEDIINELEAI